MTDFRVIRLRFQTLANRSGGADLACRLRRSLTMVALAAAICSAQQTAQDSTPQPSTSLMSQFFEHDFVNFYAFGNAIYDTELAQVSSAGSGYGGSWGFNVGGGVTLGHEFKKGTLSFSYKGDYRHYLNTNYANGTDQNLSLLYVNRLSRHWTLSTQGSGGILTYGGTFYPETAVAGPSVLTNPLSTQSRFASANITLTYQQTRRLSYSLGGQFFYSNFNYAGAFNSVGGSGLVSANYRTTARTTIGATYSHSYYSYSGSLGTTNIDGAFLTLSHQFSNHWNASVSGGFNRSHSQGTITTPISLILGQQLVTGYLVGPFNQTTISPSFQGTISRAMRHSLFSISGGQGVNAGNGTFLTSKDQFVSATYSLTRRLTNLSFGGGYTRLTSISNTVNSSYTSATASASYGWNLARYVSANLRYDFIHYDSLYSLHGLNESRFSFGLSFSSRSVPLTLF